MSARLNDHGQPVGPAVTLRRTFERPRPGPFHGRMGAVVPLGPEHADEMYASCAAPGTEPLWSYLADGPFADGPAFAERVARTVADPSSESVALVGPDGRAGGLASYLRIDVLNGSVEVGGILLGTGLQRSTTATEALYLMARHVLNDLGYRRLEWKCDALNGPSRAAALRLGFSYEGTHRNAVVYKGRSRDTAWFSITDAEWPVLAAAFEAWLSPANFDHAGCQRRTLAQVREDVMSQA